MDSSDLMTSSSRPTAEPDSGISGITGMANDDYTVLQGQVIANFQKPNIPNINVPERIIICLDICYDDSNSLYRLGDGTTFSPINMLKRILDFFLYSKSAINRRTEFALILLKDTEVAWVHNFTNNIKDILNVIDYIDGEESTNEEFDFRDVFQLLKQKVEIPEFKQDESLLPPPYIVRMILIYARSISLPLIPLDDEYFLYLKNEPYFYIDILFAHEEDCTLHKCEDIYDTLQDLDNGYSYVFEVSRNATKIHDCIAKLLAHPLQRSLQKNANYTFGICS